MARVAVVGGGILGCLTALLARLAGHHVELFEREARLWSRASAANEGKIHLGPIFALGDSSTHRLMMEAATRFADIVERAVGHRVDWDAMSSDQFEYVVMPGSLATAEELAARYSEMNTLLAQAGPRTYLGERLDSIADERARTDRTTGLPVFGCRERSIDPLHLRQHVVNALAREDVETHLASEVRAIEDEGAGTVLRMTDGTTSAQFDVIVNNTWEQQGTFVPRSHWHPLNFRVKLALRVPRSAGARALTLVQGPFGDIVGLPDYTYLSWYPSGRLAHEEGPLPTSDFLDTLAGMGMHRAAAEATVDALRATGLWDGDAGDCEIVGGAILGHGALDIDSPHSALHSRNEFRIVRSGSVLTPMSFKFTTAPLAALRTVDALREMP